MSTAGKVLVVLVLLLVPVWLLMMSGVAEYNRNGGKLLKQLQTEYQELEVKVAELKARQRELTDGVNLVQEAAAKDLVVARDRQAGIEEARSQALEIVSRMKIALDDMQAALKAAELDRDNRVAEKKQTETDLANDRENVERLKAEHAALTNQLEKLRADFAATYRSNKDRVERMTR